MPATYNKYQLSFDEHSDKVSYLANNLAEDCNSFSVRDIISDTFDYFLSFLKHLSKVDQEIARFYYIDRLSQSQIADLFGICQAAVSYRLKYIMNRIKFVIKMPTMNPIQVRKDFTKLFNSDLYEYAYLFYFVYSQNRVKNFIQTSQSGASNKHNQIINYLESIIKEINPDEDVTEKQYLAMVYCEYFKFLKKNSNILSFLYKKKDSHISDSFTYGESVFAENALMFSASKTITPVNVDTDSEPESIINPSLVFNVLEVTNEGHSAHCLYRILSIN